jgi:hypothetical protein
MWPFFIFFNPVTVQILGPPLPPAPVLVNEWIDGLMDRRMKPERPAITVLTSNLYCFACYSDCLARCFLREGSAWIMWHDYVMGAAYTASLRYSDTILRRFCRSYTYNRGGQTRGTYIIISRRLRVQRSQIRFASHCLITSDIYIHTNGFD